MKKIVVTLSILVFILVACNKKGSNKAKEESIMYEATPLANLMLRMHGDALAWKGAIETDVFESKFSTDYYGIHTVEATDPKVRNEVFTEKADKYLDCVKDLTDTKKQKKQVKKFNLMIASCVDCHSIFCQGPIDKIEKLYIVDEE